MGRKKGEIEARKGEAEPTKGEGIVFLRYLIAYNLFFLVPEFVVKSLAVGNKLS